MSHHMHMHLGYVRMARYGTGRGRGQGGKGAARKQRRPARPAPPPPVKVVQRAPGPNTLAAFGDMFKAAFRGARAALEQQRAGQPPATYPWSTARPPAPAPAPAQPAPAAPVTPSAPAAAPAHAALYAARARALEEAAIGAWQSLGGSAKEGRQMVRDCPPDPATESEEQYLVRFLASRHSRHHHA